MSFQDDIQKAITARRAAIGDHFSKGGKRANIGEVRTHHGRQMIKTASGWVPYKAGAAPTPQNNEGPIGKTKSGKEIHHSFEKTDTTGWLRKDHYQASDHHMERFSEIADKLGEKHGVTGHFDKQELALKDEQGKHHWEQSTKHNKAGDKAPTSKPKPKAEGSGEESHEDKLKAALKKRFADPESEEHHDAVHHHLKEHLKSKVGKEHHDAIDKTPWMEDEMFGGGSHKNVKETMSMVKEMADDINKYGM